MMSVVLVLCAIFWVLGCWATLALFAANIAVADGLLFTKNDKQLFDNKQNIW
jgi:hypothetical protein